MNQERKFESLAKSLLKAELRRRNLTYADLTTKLNEAGAAESEPNVRNKISRGKFSASFFLSCLDAIAVSTLHITD